MGSYFVNVPKLKGGAAYSGALQVRDSAKKLELLLNQRKAEEDFCDRYSQLLVAIDRLCEEYKKIK